LKTNRFKDLLVPALGLLIALGLAWAFFLSGPALFCREIQDGWHFHTGELLPGQSVGQTFICRRDSLARIEVRLATYGLPLVKDLSLHLVEINEPRPEPRSIIVPAGDGGERVEVHDGLQLGQTFVPQRDDLSGIRLLVDSRRLPERASVRVVVRSSGLQEVVGPVLAAAEAAAAELPRRGFFNFSFPPLTGVRGRRLFFTVDVKGAPPGRGLGVRFLSVIGDDGLWPFNRWYDLGETWVPVTRTYRSRALHESYDQSWRYGNGDLIFRPAYPPVLPAGPELRRVRKLGLSLSDNGFNSFSFEPVAQSKGRKYYFYLTSAQGPGGAATALADPADRYKYGTLVLDGVPTRGGLAFRIYNVVNRSEAAGRFLERACRHKPGPWGRPWLVVGLGLTQLVLSGLILGRVFLRPGGRS